MEDNPVERYEARISFLKEARAIFHNLMEHSQDNSYVTDTLSDNIESIDEEIKVNEEKMHNAKLGYDTDVL